MMTPQRRVFILAGIVTMSCVVGAHAGRPEGLRESVQAIPLPAAPPATNAAVGAWDAALVGRAARTIASPAGWNRADTGACRAPKTFSMSCALEKSIEESAGIRRGSDGKRIHQTPSLADCRLDPDGAGRQGTCGVLFDELPVFTLSRAKAVITGKWRADAGPEEVWAGTMSDAEYPVMVEATKTIALVSPKKYDEPLKDYNNDPATTFAGVQAFFQRLEDQLVKNGTADMVDNSDDVEIEIYAGGTGVMRTYAGWYPISGASSRDSTLRFQMDPDHQVPPNSLDRDILQRANAIIASDAVWNRA
ncbi:MAG: hypothetical protein ACRD1V_07295, partial [Vicinamibacterales bacterium]